MSFEFYITVAITVPLAIVANILTPYFVRFYVRYAAKNKNAIVEREDARKRRVERSASDPSYAMSVYAGQFMYSLAYFLAIVFSLIILRFSEGMLYASGYDLAREYLYGNPFSKQLWVTIFSQGRLAAGGAVSFIVSITVLFFGSYRLARLITSTVNFAAAVVSHKSSPDKSEPNIDQSNKKIKATPPSRSRQIID
jgi:hypothetical protein